MHSGQFNGRKIVIIGRPLSGKTTYARSLSEKLSIPHFDIDDIYWGNGWIRAEAEDFNTRIDSVLAGCEWIISGNYVSSLRKRVEMSTDVILLDCNVFTACFRYFSRIIKRMKGRERHSAYDYWFNEIRHSFFFKKVLFYNLTQKNTELRLLKYKYKQKFHLLNR
ncbi:hypothetical protein [Xenorhabdus bovienii]|uniref:hypothetical protein n=1 Tax=Xenorhabdus bovienii TaxID=40576 RepID=UPI0023B22C89|nr:hypothetical protein [Xenorhabdus bovienii]MDE9541061.1 hypothetical protein [Xenorhabdus bovienii]